MTKAAEQRYPGLCSSLGISSGDADVVSVQLVSNLVNLRHEDLVIVGLKLESALKSRV